MRRTIRNLQIYTQQVADYPSFAGINYSWFPQMYGYVEGGVPTDAWVGDRNRALAENIKPGQVLCAGRTVKQQQWYQATSAAMSIRRSAQEEPLAIQGQAIAHWKKTYELSFGRHNRLYNDAVRQIRPDVINTLAMNVRDTTAASVRIICSPTCPRPAISR